MQYQEKIKQKKKKKATKTS